MLIHWIKGVETLLHNHRHGSSRLAILNVRPGLNAQLRKAWGLIGEAGGGVMGALLGVHVLVDAAQEAVDGVLAGDE